MLWVWRRNGRKNQPDGVDPKGDGAENPLSGCDDPKKLKSIKFQRGYAKFIWYEEADEFGGMAELRSLNQSLCAAVRNFVSLQLQSTEAGTQLDKS